jgi:hypothetical protein
MKEFTCCYDFATKKEVDIVKNDREKLMQMIKQVDYVVCPTRRLSYTNASQLSVVQMFKNRRLLVAYDPVCLGAFNVLDFEIHNSSHYFVKGRAEYQQYEIDDFGNGEFKTVESGFSISTPEKDMILYLTQF